MTATSDDARLVRSVDVAWDDLDKGSTTPEAMRKGVRRKWLLEGDGDFVVQYIEMAAGHVIAPHSHDHDELMVVLNGSATFPGLGLRRRGGLPLPPSEHPLRLHGGRRGHRLPDRARSPSDAHGAPAIVMAGE